MAGCPSASGVAARTAPEAIEHLGECVLTQTGQNGWEVPGDGESGEGVGLRPGDQVGLAYQDPVQREDQAGSAENQRRRDHRYADQGGPGANRVHRYPPSGSSR